MDQSQVGQGRDGLIFNQNATEAGRYMYGHGFATLFLACAYGEEDDKDRRKRLEDILTRAVKYIGNAQSTRKGAGITPPAGRRQSGRRLGDDHAAAGLAACRNAGIPVPVDVIKKASNT